MVKSNKLFWNARGPAAADGCAPLCKITRAGYYRVGEGQACDQSGDDIKSKDECRVAAESIRLADTTLRLRYSDAEKKVC